MLDTLAMLDVEIVYELLTQKVPNVIGGEPVPYLARKSGTV